MAFWAAGVRSYAAPWDYDEGAYLASARSLHAGEPLYSAVFAAQPPIFFLELRLVFDVFGDSLVTARLFTAGCGAVALAALAAVGWRIGGPLVAQGAVFAAGTSYLFCRVGHYCEGEMAGLAAGLCATVAALSGRKPGSAFAAGALYAVAVLTKVLFAPLGLPLVVALVVGTPPAGGLRPGGFGRRLGWFVAGGGIVTGLVAVTGDLAGFYDQAIAFHLAKRATTGPWSPVGNLATVIHYSARDIGLICISVVGVVAVVRSPDRTVVGLLSGWSLAAAAFLAVHTPLYADHVILGLPVLYWLFGFGVREMVRVIGRTGPAVLVAAGVGMLCVDKSGLPLAARFCLDATPRRNLFQILLRSPPAEDDDAIRLIARSTPADALVVCDRPEMVFWAGRRTPPWLSDPGAERIGAGLLTDEDVIEHSRGATAVIFWHGRYDQFPRFKDMVTRDFQLLRSYPGGGAVYVRR